jgi:nucleotide-binding universal stress UspA family protein
MKTILAPTDFSECALNAIDYAAEIAVLTKAQLIIFHVYSLPVVPMEAPIALPVDELEKEAMDDLKKIEKSLHDKYGAQLSVKCVTELGYPVEEIHEYAKLCSADLIVMGMEGTGVLTEKVIGSITTALIKKSNCPVLAINRNIKFTSLKKIVFASDYNEINSRSVLTPLKELAELFKSHIYILNVVPEGETVATISKAVEGIKLEHLLEGIDHSFHFTTNNNVIEGINQFVDEKKIDMVAMIPRTHSVFKNLFQETSTKRMAFHTTVPLLTLHEQPKA